MAIAFKNPNAAIAVTATPVYVTPGATESVVFSLLISNITGTNATVIVEVIDSSATVTRILGKDILVPANNTLDWGSKIALETGDTLQVTASAGTSIEAYASVMEKS